MNFSNKRSSKIKIFRQFALPVTQNTGTDVRQCPLLLLLLSTKITRAERRKERPVIPDEQGTSEACPEAFWEGFFSKKVKISHIRSK